MEQSAQNREWCFICAGADDDPAFDECGVCGRKGAPLPYGSSGTAAHISEAPRDPAAGLHPDLRPGESLLGRAIRLARGIPDPEDVPGILRAIGEAKSKGRT